MYRFQFRIPLLTKHDVILIAHTKIKIISPFVVKAPFGLVHLALDPGGVPSRDELDRVWRDGSCGEAGFVVDVREPPVPFGRHRGGVVVGVLVIL